MKPHTYVAAVVRRTLCGAVWMAAAWTSASELKTYPVPSGVPISHVFDVQVRIPGKAWEHIDSYAPEVNVRKPSRVSMAYFDFSGRVDVAITYHGDAIRAVRVRPLSGGIEPGIEKNSIRFSLSQPRNLSIEVNGDTEHNLHLFAGALPEPAPDRTSSGVLYFGPGLHEPGPSLQLRDGQTVYLAGGAVVQTSILCDHVKNVHIYGRGILYGSRDGIRIDNSDHVTVEGITVMNPEHYSVLMGNSSDVAIRGLRSFSARGWGDGIDIFSSRRVRIEDIFMRNSDDTIAIYGHRWQYRGDVQDVTVANAILWPDVAHPILVGTHGDFLHPETIENLTFRGIDVLQQNEPQIDYQGCLTLNASDGNLIRHVLVDGMRIEDIANGQLVSLRVTYNRKYAAGPGRGIEDVYIKDLSYTGSHAGLSIISGYDDTRPVRGVVFENLRINGRVISDHMAGKPGYYKTGDMAGFFLGDHVEDVAFHTTEEAATRGKK